MTRRAVQELLVGLGFLAIAVAMTWPLAINLDSAISDPGDPFFTTWAIDWSYHALTTSATLFDANIFYPAKNALALSEHMVGIAMFLYPLLALGLAPLTAHNLAILLGFAGSAYAMYHLARWVTGSAGAAIVAGLAYGFVGFRFHHLPHLHFVWSLWLPIVLLALLALAERPTVGRAAALTAANVFNALASAHWMVFAGAAVLLTALCIEVAQRRISKRFWTLFIVSNVAAAAILLPFLLPYLDARAAEHTDRRVEEIFENGAQWQDFVQPFYASAVYGRFASDDAIGHERTLFAGLAVYLCAAYGLGRVFLRSKRNPSLLVGTLTALVLATGGLFLIAVMTGGGGASAWRKLYSLFQPSTLAVVLFATVAIRLTVAPLEKRNGEQMPSSRIRLAAIAAVTWIALGVLGARGLRGWLHTALFDFVPIYRGIRMPARWMMIGFVGLALGMSLCIAMVRAPRRRGVLALLLACTVIAESSVKPLRWYFVSNEPRPVYEWLATVPLSGGILELPLAQEYAYEYMWRSTRHHRPLINGVSSYTPAHYAELTSAYAGSPIGDRLLDILEQRRCSLLVVHEGLLGTRSADVREWLRRGIASGRLIVVRRFNDGGSADYAFALRSVEPGAALWREEETRDEAGRTQDENVRAFLDGDPWTFVRGPLVRYDEVPKGVVRGPIVVIGWVVADQPVKEVAALVGEHRQRYVAGRFDRSDVGNLLPWHPECSRCGFRINIPEGAVSGKTSLQMEFVLQGGAAIRKTTVFFETAPRSSARWKSDELRGLLQRLDASEAAFLRLLDGREAIDDSTDRLISSAADETDRAFARRVTLAIWGTDNGEMEDRFRADLMRGVARRRAIANVLKSPEFAQRFLEGGSVDVDAAWW